MDTFLVLLSAMAAGFISGLVAVASFRRVNPDAPSLEELALAVESLQRSVRSLTMRRVRRGESMGDPQNPETPPPGPEGAVNEKQALRARVFRSRTVQ